MADICQDIWNADQEYALRDDLAELARSIGLDVDSKFDLDDPKERTILFLDTPDYTLRDNASARGGTRFDGGN